ncbi:4Fe-4S binding protein [Sporolituus thermophilus]|uniref:Ferredoxin-type protein NapH n=1 Tax=Sporolituus thermophilus DSM 23256 TaxID=1123285 RepID=A0A1G7M0I1_9FIRM|nr:4Fe-4S binding protein [Sporolituus thermophilus]SDF54699.1 ferredoxin-type protein NapH [Sporolituus thermophilus DSM 23256]
MRLDIKILRKLIQFSAVGILTLPLWWPGNPIWLGTYLSSRFFGVAFTDPLAALEVMLASREFIWPLFWSVLPLVAVAIVLGRIFCSWICPLNTVFELAAAIRKPARKLENGWQPYLLLGGFVLLAGAVSLPVFTMMSPIGILSRALVLGTGLEIIVPILLVALELVYAQKTWCKKACPVGALYGILSRFRILRLKMDDAKCNNCGACYSTCSMGVDVGSAKPLDIMNCTNCGDCIGVCPNDAINYCWFARQKGGAIKDESFTSDSR